MRITRDILNGILKLSQENYVKKVLNKFNMDGAKPLSTHLPSHFKLYKEQLPSTKHERAHIAKVPYAFAIGSLMYVMVCTRPNTAYAVGILSKCMNSLRKQH